jgi:hypothetical protein
MRWKTAATFGAAMLLVPATASAAPELSVGDRLQDRREVSAGTRAYSVGFQDGRFYANGWHITGEMGGVWAPPLKLADGLWFGVEDQWAGPATKFTSGRGYTRYDLPAAAGLGLRRIDFVPDGRRAALYGLELSNPGPATRTVTVKVDVRSELLGAYPWGFDNVVPNAKDNLADRAAYENGALVFTDKGTLPGGEPHDYAMLAASDRRASGGEVGAGHWGPQPGKRCAPADQVAPSACDDGPFGNGAGGQLRYRVTVKPRQREIVWIALAGSDRGLQAARRELAGVVHDPGRLLAQKAASRLELSHRSRVDLPGDRQLQEAVEWGKQNIADLTQTATDLRIRFVDQGKQYPAPVTTLREATFVGAGYPDYPWLFATDGEYTAFASVAVGQFEAIKEHLLALRDISDALNARSGKVAHEVVTDGSVWFGANTDPGNTDESVKFPSAVALVWRWTGDDRFRDALYDFSVRNLRYVTNTLDDDKDGWPEGLGNVEREGMGEEKLDNTVYYVRGLYDLADLAASKRDRATERWARDLADRVRARFDPAWWDAPNRQYADSLENPANTRIQQKHWIGQTPMEAELTIDGAAVPGLAPYEHGNTALAERETPCYSGEPPYNRGLFHTGCGGGPTGAGEQSIFSLNTAIQAVGLGNYGRDASRYTGANSAPMFEPDEMPGALPEILPSPGFDATGPNDRNIDRCWTCRAMFVQAWGHYGTAWPVIHQQLGVRPSLGTGALEVVPQLPGGQTRAEGRSIRLGKGELDVRVERTGRRYVTSVRADVKVRDLRVGATLPRGAKVGEVTLDGRRVKHPLVRETNRGVEVTVAAGGGRHTVMVTAG